MSSTRQDRFYDLSAGQYDAMAEVDDNIYGDVSNSPVTALAARDFPDCKGGKWRLYVSMRRLEEPPEAVEVDEVPDG